MTDFLLQLGALSLSGAAAILFLWGMTRFTRSRCAARWRCWAWLLLCLRLAVPFSLPLLFPARSAAPVQISVPADQVLYQATPQQTVSSPANPAPESAVPIEPHSAPASPQQTAVVPAAPFAFTLSGLLVALWLAGVAVVLAWNLWNHLRFCRWLKHWTKPVAQSEIVAVFNQAGDCLHLHRRPQLRACRGLRTPMLAGLFHPVLLLPMGKISGEALSCSLLHELAHFRRRDIPFKALTLWVSALHWFNPAVWLMVQMVDQDIELACDDAVLRRLSPKEYTAYGETILQAAARLKKVT